MKRRIALAVGVLVLVVVAGASTYAWGASADATQTINGCVDPAGLVRIIAATGTCHSNETAISWNTVGPQGPAGQQGPAGPQGATGPQGPAAPDPDAVSATIAVTGPGGAFSQSPIPVTGVSHELSVAVSAGGLGTLQNHPLTFTKQVDTTTTKFVGAVVTKATLSNVLLTVPIGSDTFTIQLTNAHITDYQLHGSTETFTLTFPKIKWTYVHNGTSSSVTLNTLVK